MKILGIEKRTAVLYARIKPSVLAQIQLEAKKHRVKPAAVIEALFLERTHAIRRNTKKHR